MRGASHPSIILCALLLGACRQQPPPAPSSAPLVLSRDAVAERVQTRLQARVPGIKISRTSPSTMSLSFPDGMKADFALDPAFAVCGRRPENCDAYVDKLVDTMRKEEPGEEDKEEREEEE